MYEPHYKKEKTKPIILVDQVQHKSWLKARNFGIKKKWDCTICVVKTKAQLICAVTASDAAHSKKKLIIGFQTCSHGYKAFSHACLNLAEHDC